MCALRLDLASFLLACNFVALSAAATPENLIANATLDLLMVERPLLGLDDQNTLEVRNVETDGSGASHVRLQQRYRGLRVWGGQAIAHTDPQGARRSLTNALVRHLQLEVTPNLAAAEALAVAERRELDHSERAELEHAMERAWASLPSHYQWLKDWEYV